MPRLHTLTACFTRPWSMGGWRRKLLKEVGSRAAIILLVPLSIGAVVVLGKGRPLPIHMSITIAIFSVACILFQSYMCATMILDKYDLLPLIDTDMMVNPDWNDGQLPYRVERLASTVKSQYREGFHGRYMKHRQKPLTAFAKGRMRTSMEQLSGIVNNGNMTTIENHAVDGTETIRTVQPAAGHGRMVRILDMIDES